MEDVASVPQFRPLALPEGRPVSSFDLDGAGAATSIVKGSFSNLGLSRVVKRLNSLSGASLDKELMRLHQRLYHSSPHRLVNLLDQAGCEPHVLSRVSDVVA